MPPGETGASDIFKGIQKSYGVARKIIQALSKCVTELLEENILSYYFLHNLNPKVLIPHVLRDESSLYHAVKMLLKTKMLHNCLVI